MTSLAQAEVCGSALDPFSGDLDALTKRAKSRELADTRDIYERIYRGKMQSDAECSGYCQRYGYQSKTGKGLAVNPRDIGHYFLSPSIFQ